MSETQSTASPPVAQRTLSADQVMHFYHDLFVRDQAESFIFALGAARPRGRMVVDIGGGCGHFAAALQASSDYRVRVIDMDPGSVAECRRQGIDAEIDDALHPAMRGNESIASFNLILHHLVASTEQATSELQRRALLAWQRQVEYVFVNEYIYDSYGFHDAAGRLIWQITSSRVLSAIGSFVAKWVSALQANTFGVGVRFRSTAGWMSMFDSLGYEVVAHVKGTEERVRLPLRALLIKHKRRDSFLLRVKRSPDSITAGPAVTELSEIRRSPRAADQTQETGAPLRNN